MGLMERIPQGGPALAQAHLLTHSPLSDIDQRWRPNTHNNIESTASTDDNDKWDKTHIIGLNHVVRGKMFI